MSRRDPASINEQAQDEARKAEAQAEELANVDLRELVAIGSGRRVLVRLLEMSNVLGASFSESHAIMAHDEGRRSIGCELLEWVRRAVGPTGLAAVIEAGEEIARMTKAARPQGRDEEPEED